MTRKEIEQKVNGILADEFDVEESTLLPDANIRETLGLDSLSLVDLVALVQQAYKITIPVAELRNIETFNNLYDYIEQHVEKV